MFARFERLAVLVLGLALTTGALADDEKTNDRPWYYGYKFEAGITGNSDSLKVMPKGVYDAEMVTKDDIAFSPYIQFATPDGYFGASSFGYNVFATYKTFEFDNQLTLQGNRNVGTSATGHYFFVTPQVFYDFWRSENSSAKFGVGYGFGRISAKGTFRPGNISGNQVQSFSISDNGTAPGVMAELRYKSIVARFYGIQTTISDSSGDKLRVYRAGGDIGYRWTF